MDFLIKWAPVLFAVIGAASTVVALAAPLTENEWDNKLAKALKWVVENVLAKLALNPK